MPGSGDDAAIPHQSATAVFRRFLRFGFLAWGGPVAQIAMIRQELVEEERWISPARFNRVLAVYQVLPGPEAHELCVYFGMLARGRLGAVLAGLGFMLPGFMMMFALSWWYVTFGGSAAQYAGLFHGLQAAVGALIVRAVHRIGVHAISDWPLAMIAVVAVVAQLSGVHFSITLAASGLAYAAIKRRQSGASVFLPAFGVSLGTALAAPSLAALFVSGLRTGLLTFGGAYTAIPFLQHDAVVTGGWMTNAQFLDGLALSSILPAPLIIFATFVGFVGGGAVGALVLTAGVFLPAFAFTLIGHRTLERLISNPAAHALLDGVTAGVVGLIAATTAGLLRAAVSSIGAGAIFLAALLLVYRWRSRAAIPVVILGGGLAGLLL